MNNPESPADAPRGGRGAVWLFIAFAGGLTGFLGWWILAPIAPETIERYYALGLYRVLVAALTPLTERVPFSIAFYLLLLMLLAAPVSFVLGWLHLRRRGWPHWAGFLGGIGGVLLLAMTIAAWFVLFWGAGYRRVPIETRLALETHAIAPEEGAALRTQVLGIIEENLPRDPADRDVDRAVAAISEAMAGIVAEWDARPIRLPARVKPAPAGLLLRQGTAGVCAPFTLEPNVDAALPDTAFVSVAAHELGHVAGFNSEDGATFVGFVAGLRAPDPFARYAVALDIYTDLVRALPQPAREAEMARLPDAAREDLRRVRETYQAYVSPVLRNAQRRVYEQYLQSQGVRDGLENYNRGVSLFAFAWRQGLVEAAGIAPPA